MRENEQTDDEFVEEDEAGNSAATVKKLRERIKKAVAEKQEYLDGWQRARAEFTNYKKQEVTFGAEREARAKVDLIEQLLPALDALELALKHHASDATLRMLESQFLSSLKSMGIERFGAVGDEVDPRYYEPLSQKKVNDESQDQTIVSVERSGYKVGDIVIRPAQVVIGIFSGKET
jgi:molecular chaperone GrpE